LTSKNKRNAFVMFFAFINGISSEFRNAKSIVKHLLVADLSKRYGNLKNGVNDIKNHRWFSDIDWNLLVQKKLPVPYKPTVK